MSDSSWPDYRLFITSARTLAENSGIPRENAGAGLFAIAVTVLAAEWGNAHLAAWLRRPGRCNRQHQESTVKRPRIPSLQPRIGMINTMRTEVAGARGNSAERGYDHAWRKLRLRFLREHPICECEDCQAGKLRVTGANVVDHIQSIAERPDLRLEWSNLRAMSKPCHDKHTARTQGYGRSRGKR